MSLKVSSDFAARSPGRAVQPGWLLNPLFNFGSLLLLVLLLVLGAFDVEAFSGRTTTRNIGYFALGSLCVAYLFVARRLLLYRRAGNVTRWLKWHVGASWLAFALALVHSRGHASASTTFVMMCLFWTVMVGGVLGFCWQRLCYRFIRFLVPHELGPDRLTEVRQKLDAEASSLDESLLTSRSIKNRDFTPLCSLWQKPDGSQANSAIARNLWLSLPLQDRRCIEDAVETRFRGDVRGIVIGRLNGFVRLGSRQKVFAQNQLQCDGWPDEVRQLAQLTRRTPAQAKRQNRLVLEALFEKFIEKSSPPAATVDRLFIDQAIGYLQSDFASLSEFVRKKSIVPVTQNEYIQLTELLLPDSEQKNTIGQLWKLVQERREIDIEFWLHRFARGWILVHVPLAYALAVLVVVHVWVNIKYGGF